MDENQIRTRLLLLFEVLQYSSQRQEKLTVFQRILINQERGALMHALENPNADLRPVPASVEVLIHELDYLSQQYQWQPLNTRLYNDH